MRVTVQTYLVSGVPHFGQLFRKRLDAVGGREEGRADVVFGVQFKQAVDSYCGAVDAARDVCWVLRRAVAGVYPVCYCVDVDYVGS